MEVMVACTAMAAAKEVAEKSDSEQPNDGKWSKWKRGAIIGAAALTGGTLLAITGGTGKFPSVTKTRFRSLSYLYIINM